MTTATTSSTPAAQSSIELSLDTTAKGLAALRAFNAQKNKSLVGNDRVTLSVTTHFVPASAAPRPHTARVPHPIHESTRTCIFVKDPQSSAKELFAEKGVSFDKVIGIQKYKKKFSSFEQKRTLCSEYDIFYADEAVVLMLGHLLGREFHKAKKCVTLVLLLTCAGQYSRHSHDMYRLPIPIDTANLTAEKMAELKSSTMFNISPGTALSIAVGSLSSHSDKQLAENIQAVLEPLLNRLCDPKTLKALGGERAAIIRSLGVKTPDSICIPIYTSVLEAKSASAEPATSTANSQPQGGKPATETKKPTSAKQKKAAAASAPSATESNKRKGEQVADKPKKAKKAKSAKV
ncbi:proteasome-interacting protein cic1 [Sorochytrium milnesiophthora]